MVNRLRAGLARLQTSSPVVGDVRGLGLMVAMDVVMPENRQLPNPVLREALVQAAFEEGLLLLGCGESAIRFCPPLCITGPQVDVALEILTRVLSR